MKFSYATLIANEVACHCVLSRGGQVAHLRECDEGMFVVLANQLASAVAYGFANSRLLVARSPIEDAFVGVGQCFREIRHGPELIGTRRGRFRRKSFIHGLHELLIVVALNQQIQVNLPVLDNVLVHVETYIDASQNHAIFQDRRPLQSASDRRDELRHVNLIELSVLNRTCGRNY